MFYTSHGSWEGLNPLFVFETTTMIIQEVKWLVVFSWLKMH